MLPHLAARLFGTPLLIHQPKLEIILSVLGPRIGLPEQVGQGGYARSERPVSESPSGIAVIPIHGSLVRRTSGLEADSGLTSYQSIQQMLEMARDDSAVDALLLDIDSPGGESSGVFDLADKIRTIGLQKPIWAVANDMAFSAAYAMASAAQKVYVSRTGGVGSIGVIAMHVDQSVKDAQEGLHYTAVYAGSRKNDLSPHGPMTTEAQRFLQGEVDRVYGLFVDSVARYRGLSSNAVRDTEAGVFFGKDAVRAGLPTVPTRSSACSMRSRPIFLGVSRLPRWTHSRNWRITSPTTRSPVVWSSNCPSASGSMRRRTSMRHSKPRPETISVPPLPPH